MIFNPLTNLSDGGQWGSKFQDQINELNLFGVVDAAAVVDGVVVADDDVVVVLAAAAIIRQQP